MSISKSKIAVWILFFLFCSIGWSFFAEAIARTIPAEEEPNLIRLHVLANSDSEEDQKLKLKVRDAVLHYLSPKLEDIEDGAQARQVILAHKADLIKLAYRIVLENGYYYPVDLEVGVFDFPIKSYGDLVLPAGPYEAVRILIGDAQGANWWCVLYPPLCFIDESKAMTMVKDHKIEVNDQTIHLKCKLWEWIAE